MGHQEPVRMLLIRIGLVLGPVLVIASLLIGLGPEPASMRAGFDAMAAHPTIIVIQDVLETVGFAMMLAALAAAAWMLPARGRMFGAVGAVLAVLGIAGFGLSNGAGLAVVALAQLPDRDTAFQVASTISADGPLATASTISWVLEIVAQLGILLVLVALWRAGLTPIWPLLLCVLGVLVNAVLGTMVATLIADVLLLVVGVWVVLGLSRTTHTVPSSAPAELAR